MNNTIRSMALAGIFLAANLHANAGPQDDLYAATMNCDIAAAQKALAAGANVNTLNPKNNMSVLSQAYFCPEIAKLLLEKGADPNIGSYAPIVSAASVASIEVMKMLLDKGADVNKPAMGETALQKVVQMTNCAQCAEMLIAKGAKTDVIGKTGGNLIREYASYGLPASERPAAMKKYGDLLKGYKVNVPDWYYNPPANINGAPGEILKLLVTNKVDINKEEKSGMSPLFVALTVGKDDVILSLLENGAEYNTTHVINDPELGIIGDDLEYTPLMAASTKGLEKVVNWLVKKGDLENPSVSGMIETNEGNFVKLSGLTAIYMAINSRSMACVKALAESDLKWGDFSFKMTGGKKFKSSYGAKRKTYQFAGEKQGKLRYNPSRYASFTGNEPMAEYLKSKGL
jgi:ankyrin repeat protein